MGLRRLTRLLANRNASGTWGDVLSDSYNLIFGIVLMVGMLWSPLQRASAAPWSAAPFRLDPARSNVPSAGRAAAREL